MPDFHWGIPVLLMLVFIFYLNAYSEMEPFVNYGATDASATATAASLSAIGGGASTDTLPGDPNAGHDNDDDDTTEGFANYYKKCGDAQPTGILKDIFETYEIYKTRGDQWELFLPCNYTHAERELRTTAFPLDAQATLVPGTADGQQPRAVFAVDGCDQLVSKNRLWTLLLQAYGRPRASTLMPPTYVFTSPADAKQFLEDYTPGAMYICKKNVQRKQGLLRTRNLDLILRSHVQGFKLVQTYLTDVYTVKRRKLNLRYYVLLVCDAYGTKRAYVHREGKCLYTAKPYDPDADDDAHHITSTGVTAAHYADDQLPLTFAELRAHMYGHSQNYDAVFKAVSDKLQYVVEAVMPAMCINSKFKHHLRFQLFGVDVLLTSKLDPYVLEFNKGPNMKPVNQADYALKRVVLEDTFKQAGFLPTDRGAPSGFVLLREMDVNNVGRWTG